MGLDRLIDEVFCEAVNLLAEVVLLKDISELQDRCLNRNPIADHVDPEETVHCRNLDQRILHRWIAEVLPLLQKMDTQHDRERIGRAPTLRTALGIVGLDQINQRFPRHHLLHLAQKSLALGALLGHGFLLITKSELLAAHDPWPYLRFQSYFAWMSRVSQILSSRCSRIQAIIG